MKISKLHIILLGVFIFLSPHICKADWNSLETTNETQARNNQNEYQQRQNNPYKDEPLGGYQENLSGSSVSPYSDESNNQPTVSKESLYEPKTFETIDEQHSRQEAEHYEERQNNSYNMESLGGYSEKLGDSNSGDRQ